MTEVLKKFQSAREAMISKLLEREEEVSLAQTALICQESLLLVGPPGTAKSLLLDSLIRWMNCKGFSYLLTKYTTPEELFGPISVMGLKEDRYRRIITGKIPEAECLFLDEVFKGSSAILNTLLRILNERVFENGDGSFIHCPLKLVVAASNEWPQDQEGGKELGALFDRFLFRKTVRPILAPMSRKRLLWERDHTPVFSSHVSMEEIEQARKEALALPWSEEGKQALETVLEELKKEGILPGDRRQYKSVAAIQAYAWLEGASQVEPEHLEIASHILWDDPVEQPRKVSEVIVKLVNPVNSQVNSLVIEAQQVFSEIDIRVDKTYTLAMAKLREVRKKLDGLKKVDRTKKALAWVDEEMKKIKLAYAEKV